MFQRLPAVSTSGATMPNPNNTTKVGIAVSNGARGNERRRTGSARSDSVMTTPNPGQRLDADSRDQHHAEHQSLVLRVDSQQIERVRDKRQEQGSKHHPLG